MIWPLEAIFLCNVWYIIANQLEDRISCSAKNCVEKTSVVYVVWCVLGSDSRNMDNFAKICVGDNLMGCSRQLGRSIPEETAADYQNDLDGWRKHSRKWDGRTPTTMTTIRTSRMKPSVAAIGDLNLSIQNILMGIISSLCTCGDPAYHRWWEWFLVAIETFGSVPWIVEVKRVVNRRCLGSNGVVVVAHHGWTPKTDWAFQLSESGNAWTASPFSHFPFWRDLMVSAIHWPDSQQKKFVIIANVLWYC